ATQAIYYSPRIAGGANDVTVAFSQPANYPDIRIAEYSGLVSTNALDSVGVASGNSITSSASLTTTNAPDLLVTGNLVQTSTSALSPPFILRLETSPDGDVYGDATVTAKGTKTSTAPLSSSGYWVHQVAAFKIAPGALPNSAATSVPTPTP